MSVVANVDGTVEMEAPQEVLKPTDDGMMQISVDESGHFHTEEGFMLMQTKSEFDSSESEEAEATQEDANEEKMEEWDPSIIGSAVPNHPSWQFEAMTNVDSLSLLQLDAKVE